MNEMNESMNKSRIIVKCVYIFIKRTTKCIIMMNW